MDLTEDKDVLLGASAGSSVEKISMSIQHLATSLQQLHTEAAALEVEEPPAKRPRKEATLRGPKDELMESPNGSQSFGKAGSHDFRVC